MCTPTSAVTPNILLDCTVVHYIILYIERERERERERFKYGGS